MNLVTLLQARASDRASAPALIEGHGRNRRSLTFAQLEENSARGATLLRESGLVPGDAILVLLDMSIELYVLIAALFRCGLTAVFLDPGAGAAHVDRCAAMLPIKGFVGTPKAHLLRFVCPRLRKIPIKLSVGGFFPGAVRWERIHQLAPWREIHPAKKDTPALITFTSGTSGQPKAAVRSQGFLAAQYQALARSLQLEPGEKDFSTLPIFVLANLAGGVTSVLPNVKGRRLGLADGATFLDQIESESPSRMTIAPAALEQVCAQSPTREHALSSLRKIFTGGSPVLPWLMDRVHQCAPQAEIWGVYGSTEAEPIALLPRTSLSPADRLNTMNGGGLLAGTAVPEIELRIIEDHWGRKLGPFSSAEFATRNCSTDQAGEIVVRGPHVLPGYLQGAGDDETKIDVDGQRWHRTGDAGRLDLQGRLWLLGRCSERVCDQHGAVYPLMVEAAALATEGIRRAAFLAVNGKRTLALELARAVDLAALRKRLGWAHLAQIITLEQIPVDQRHHGKIDYPRLRSRLMQPVVGARTARPRDARMETLEDG